MSLYHAYIYIFDQYLIYVSYYAHMMRVNVAYMYVYMNAACMCIQTAFTDITRVIWHSLICLMHSYRAYRFDQYLVYVAD